MLWHWVKGVDADMWFYDAALLPIFRTWSFVSLYEEWLTEDTAIVNDSMVFGRETYRNARAMLLSEWIELDIVANGKC